MRCITWLWAERKFKSTTCGKRLAATEKVNNASFLFGFTGTAVSPRLKSRVEKRRGGGCQFKAARRLTLCPSRR
jgi:hypothetical protein